MYDCVVAIVKRGLAAQAVDIARAAGAGGGTILHGRGSGGHDLKVFSMDIQKEKEIIFWLTDTRVSRGIAAALYEQLELEGEGGGAVFMMPSGALGLEHPVAVGLREETEEEKAAHPKGPSTAEEMLPQPGDAAEEASSD